MMDPDRYYIWYVGRTRECFVCDREGCGVCGHMGVIPGEEWGTDVSVKVECGELYAHKTKILLVPNDDGDHVVNISSDLRRVGMGWLDSLMLDILPKKNAADFLEYMASKGEFTSNDVGDIIADGLSLTQYFHEAGLPALERAIRKLLEAKAAMLLLEYESADLSASLGVGTVEVQTPEQFSAPLPPESTKRKRRRT